MHGEDTKTDVGQKKKRQKKERELKVAVLLVTVLIFLCFNKI